MSLVINITYCQNKSGFSTNSIPIFRAKKKKMYIPCEKLLSNFKKLIHATIWMDLKNIKMTKKKKSQCKKKSDTV